MSRTLLIVHGLIGMALLGATTHLAIVTLVTRDTPRRLMLCRRYAKIASVLFLCVNAVGLVIYPEYRYRIAGLFLNRYSPWASNLFEIKEALVAFSAPLALGLLFFSRRSGEVEDEGNRWAFRLCALGLFATVAFATVSGMIVVAEKGL